jgi:protoheme IX farnesyltransferase
LSHITALEQGEDKQSMNGFVYTLKAYFSLLKPRVMSLSIFTSFVAMVIAPGEVSLISSALIILAISIGSGASGALNMWYERDTDKLMTRTMNRAIPSGIISPNRALIFGTVLSIISIAILYYASNSLAASLLALTIVYYVLVYTVWLKRRTPQNIVIGGAAGAFPPMIGWSAVAGTLSYEPLIIFTIIFLWTPPHFWALALYRSGEYKKAGIPMMPVIVGPERTLNMIVAYSAILFPVTISLGLFYSYFYTISATVLSVIFVYLSLKLKNTPVDAKDFEKKAQQFFYFTIIFLFNIFAILLIDSVVM